MANVFIKENFEFHGGYLNYFGADHKAMFIARFKYGSKPWKSWVNFIVKNFEVDEFKMLAESGMSPLAIMESKGFVSPKRKKK